MSKYTKKDIIRMVDEEDVEFIRLQFTDIFGTLKNVAITASQKSADALRVLFAVSISTLRAFICELYLAIS